MLGIRSTGNRAIKRVIRGSVFAALAVALSAGALLLPATADAHGTGWPYHKMTNVFCGGAGSFGNTTNTIRVRQPENVFAFNRTAGTDYEVVYWRGYVAKWSGSTWVRIRTGGWSPGTVASDGGGLVEMKSWTGEAPFYQLPSGYLMGGVDLWWRIRGVMHSSLVSEHFSMPYNGFYSYIPYCTF